MNRDELRAALDGLFAYDSGSSDSGIHDEGLRQRCKVALRDISNENLTLIFRDLWFTDEAIRAGYGIEDAMDFARWLMDYMEVDIIP